MTLLNPILSTTFWHMCLHTRTHVEISKLSVPKQWLIFTSKLDVKEALQWRLAGP